MTEPAAPSRAAEIEVGPIETVAEAALPSEPVQITEEVAEQVPVADAGADLAVVGEGGEGGAVGAITHETAGEDLPAPAAEPVTED